MRRSQLNQPKVCVIGAGPSGLSALKALSDAGLSVDCYEKSDKVGGNWVFENSNGLSSAYRSLHINTSKRRSEFSDFPMPDHYPDYPRHELLASYFEAYVQEFRLARFIRFQTGVVSATPLPDGTWRVELTGGQIEHYQALVVANGHHWDPRLPDPPAPGQFDGIAFHSHHYIDPTAPYDLRDKNVIVVGLGNSAVDIACELSHAGNARKVFLSVRRGAYILPKYLFGRPIDAGFSLPAWFPFRRSLITLLFSAVVGRMERFGLPKPDHRLLEAHPTVSSELLIRLGSGDLVAKPPIQRFLHKNVEFSDGSVEPIDAVIYSTGYRVSFPFFAPDVLAPVENKLELFHRVFHPDIPNLFFIGLCQPLGAIMPITEVQGRWVAECLKGDYALPPQGEISRQLAREQTARERRYVPSARHTMQIDVERYLEAVERERRHGRRRAGRAAAQR